MHQVTHGNHRSFYIRNLRTTSSVGHPYLASNPLPASFLRGGTSKGIFINRDVLPEDRTANGMGGGVSSLSKICVVEKPTQAQADDGIDVVYTFVQVGIRDTSIDYSGNCGNLSSMIGVFAVDEGIGHLRPERLDTSQGVATVRSLNTNTNKVVETTFPVVAAFDTAVAGVPGKASQIVLDFVSPAGARTGKLLPTGNPVDYIDIDVSGTSSRFRISLVDATNPTVFIASEDLRSALGLTQTKPSTSMMTHPSAQAQPKIAALSPPPADDADADIVIQAFSMGVLHKAGVASGVKGTSHTTLREETDDLVTMRHAGGTVDVGSQFDAHGNVLSARVVRTGRRLMKGVVWW
ncbi:hypothetical protein BC629DRAFT_1582476 [Irpex lacteus]|nr:hypothetical protein BC629DRAFT_1582476 [Irpex lacteus]